VVVANGQHVRPHPVERAVDRPLRVHRSPLRIDRSVVEVELHDVTPLDQLRTTRAGEKVAVGPSRVPDADVTEGVDHPLIGEDPVGDDEVVEHGLEGYLVRH
jgi:hypothetical protein